MWQNVNRIERRSGLTSTPALKAMCGTVELAWPSTRAMQPCTLSNRTQTHEWTDRDSELTHVEFLLSCRLDHLTAQPKARKLDGARRSASFALTTVLQQLRSSAPSFTLGVFVISRAAYTTISYRGSAQRETVRVRLACSSFVTENGITMKWRASKVRSEMRTLQICQNKSEMYVKYLKEVQK